MGEEVICSLWIGFFFVWILFCFESYLSHALPSQGSTRADGLSTIAYCLNSLNGKRTWGGGVLVGAGLAAQAAT